MPTVGTQEIPRERWRQFFDEFSKNHEGWIVSLDVLGPVLGAQVEVVGLSLVGISADVKSRGDRIELILGGRPGLNMTRIVDSPKYVWRKSLEMPGTEAIDVVSDDGTITLMRFLHVLQPDPILRYPIER